MGPGSLIWGIPGDINVTTEAESTDDLIRSARELKERYWDDPHRPRYHFMAPWGWMNDINGAIFWKGRYHVFYQHLSGGGVYRAMRWAHTSSVDLVHWVHHPIALTPSEDGYDRRGCWSGGAFVTREGVPAVIYEGGYVGACIATAEDDLLVRWTKHPSNPVVPASDVGDIEKEDDRSLDPCAWVDGDTYYALIGSRVGSGEGDGTYLFRSQDLAVWDYVGPFYRSERRWTEADEDCAVPDFFPLGDRHMLLFASHLLGSQYYLGRLEGDEFHPQVHGRMCGPGGQLGGPRTLLDGNGRRIYFDWVPEAKGRDEDAAKMAGWSGVMTLPRILSLTDDGTLGIEPAPELDVLRRNHRVRRDVRIAPDSEFVMDDVKGDCLELAVEIVPDGAREFGLKVRSSPDGTEQTAVLYDAPSGNLKVEIDRSTLDRRIRYEPYRQPEAVERLPESERAVPAQEMPFRLAPGESLVLRVFLDRSVLEAYANGRQAITQRIYPTRSDSLGVSLFSRGGGVSVRSFEAWDLAPTHG